MSDNAMARAALIAELKRAFAAAPGHESGWEAVADKAIELLQPTTEYEGVVALFKGLPMTWLPALTLRIVEEGYARPVWTPGGCSTAITSLEKRNGWGTP